MRRARFVVAAAPVAVLAGTTASAASAPVPGGDPGYDANGFGHPHPSQIIYGATAQTFNLNHVRWTHWGAKQALGTGEGRAVPPCEPIAASHVVAEKLVPYDLGPCKGKRAYRRMARYVPSLGPHLHPNRRNDDSIFCTTLR